MNTDKSEWILLDTDLTTRLAILPAGKSHLYFELNEPGSGELKIPLTSNSAALIESGMFADGYYRGASRGGFFVDNIGRYEINSGENGGRWMSISGRGALALLEDAIVWDTDGSSTTRLFDGFTRADVLITLIVEAQARGALAALTYDFSATLDSDGNSWTDADSISVNVGVSLLDLLRQFAKTGIDFDINLSGGSFVLSAYKNGKGSDLSSTVYFRAGVNCQEVYDDERSESIKNALLVKYKGGFNSVKDDTSITANRRRESILNLEAAQTSSSATTYAAAKLEITKDPRKSISVKIYDGVGPRVFIDYGLGDYITLDILGVEASYRIYGIECDFDGTDYSNVVVDLNSIINDNDLQMQSDLDWLMSQWNTANDGNLIEISYWAAIGDPNITALAGGGIHVIGNTLFSAGTTDLYYCDMITRQWTSVPIGRTITALESIGTDLYIGCFHEIFKWDTTSSTLTSIGLVSDLSSPLAEQIIAMCVMGTDLYVTGVFDEIDGNAINMMAKYDSLTDTWTAWGTGGSGSAVLDLLTVGSNIYACGSFTSLGGVSASRVAVWNGSTWAALDTGLDFTAFALAQYGTSILAGGGFTGHISEWNGVSWATFGGGVTGTVYDIAVFLSDVYVVGNFTDIGNYIAKYSGGFWYPLLGGLNANANSILLYGDDVIVSGAFTQADGKDADHLAEYFTSFESLLDYLSNSSTFDMGAAIHNAPAAALTSASEIPFWDSVTNKLRKITWTNVKATLKTYFDTLYVALTGDQTVAGIKTFTSFPVTPSAAPSADYEVANKKYVDDNSSLPALTASRVVITDGSGTITTDSNLIYSTTTNHETHGLTANNWGGNNAIIQANTAASTQHIIEVYGTSSTTAPQVVGVRGGGTYSVPTGISSGEMMLRLRGWAFDSSGALESNSSGDIRIIASEAHSPTARGTRLEFYTTPATTTTLTKSLVVGEGGIASNITAAKTLTLTATDNYTLTVPATGTAALLATANVFTTNQTITPATDVVGLTINKSTTANALEVKSGATVLAWIKPIGAFAASASHTATSGAVLYNSLSVLANAASASTSNITGLQNSLNTNTNVNFSGTLTALYNIASHEKTQIASLMIGQRNELRNISSGTVTSGQAAYTLVQNTGGGSIVNGYGNYIEIKNTGAGSITNAYGVYIPAPTISAGSINSLYGLFMDNVTGAASANYAIYTNAGLVRHGDQTAIVGSADRVQLQVTGHTTQTNPVAYIIDNTSATNAIRNVLKLEAQSTGTAATGLGAGLLYTIETATAGTIQSAAQVAAVATDNTNATRNYALRETTYPAAGAVGYRELWSQTAIAGTSLVVLAAGRITEAVTIQYTAAEITGAVVSGGIAVLEPSDTLDILSDGTSILTLTVSAGGELSIARSAGTDTFKAVLSMVYI